MTSICDTRPEDIGSFQEGIYFLDLIREEDTRSSREEIIPIIEWIIGFADTTEELQTLLSWTTPGHYLDELVLKKMIETAKTQKELDCLLGEKLIDINSNLWNSWKKRERKITMNRT